MEISIYFEPLQLIQLDLINEIRYYLTKDHNLYKIDIFDFHELFIIDG